MINKEIKPVLDFLKSQRVLIIASQGKDLWISNVFYVIDNNFKMYFVSPENTKHSKQILIELGYSLKKINKLGDNGVVVLK